MLRFICAIVSVVVVVNANPYGSSGGYGSPVPGHSGGVIVLPNEPSVSYHIPPPSHWNPAPAAPAGPSLTPVNAHSISGSGTPSWLVGISSQPSASATAASANVPLPAGGYKLLIVPSYEVPNVVGPEPGLPIRLPSTGGHGGHGGRGGHGGHGGRGGYGGLVPIY